MCIRDRLMGGPKSRFVPACFFKMLEQGIRAVDSGNCVVVHDDIGVEAYYLDLFIATPRSRVHTNSCGSKKRKPTRS